MKENEDNNDQDCDGYHRPLFRTHFEQLQLVVVGTVCVGSLVAVVGVVLLDKTGGAHAKAVVVALTALVAMLIRRVLKDRPKGGDDS